MGSREEMRRAKCSDGLCVAPACGKRALKNWQHCEDHIPDRDWIAKLAAERKRGETDRPNEPRSN